MLSIDSVKGFNLGEELIGIRCACMIFFSYVVETNRILLSKGWNTLDQEKKPPRGVLRKRCSENMQQIRNTPAEVWFQ